MIKSYVKEVQQYLLCDKKGLHTQQVLDLICTSPLCRQNPLACSVCFDERHKHHNVVSFSKFIDEFSRQSRNYDKKSLLPQLNRVQQTAKSTCAQLRKNINKKLDEFEKDIDSYVDYLFDQIDKRNEVYKLANLQASPDRLTSTINLSQLRKSIKFILNNTKFNDDIQICKIATPLKEANEKLQSLISKLQYISFNCMRRVETELDRMKQLRQTISNYKKQDIKVFKDDGTPASVIRINKQYHTQQSTKLKPTLNRKQQWTPIKPFTTEKTENNEEQNEGIVDIQNSYQSPKFTFTMKHPQLTISRQILKSNVQGREAQYALALPNLDDIPTSKWVIKIISCKDIYCANSLAVGISHSRQLKRKHFQARANTFDDCYMLSSSGDVLVPGNVTNNPQMKFSTGDLLQLQYDSYYQLLEIKNQNGNIVSIKVQKKLNDPLFICARMTYAGDSVQLINY